MEHRLQEAGAQGQEYGLRGIGKCKEFTPVLVPSFLKSTLNFRTGKISSNFGVKFID